SGRSRSCLGPVHLQSLLQCVAEIVQQFLAGLSLGVDAGHFLDPTDPPVAVLLDDCVVFPNHKGSPRQTCGPSSFSVRPKLRTEERKALPHRKTRSAADPPTHFFRAASASLT